jgi:glucosylceramidase
MVLDLDGGPTYIENFVDSPVIVNATGGEFYKQPMFYHLGHFSKFVPNGSVRIDASSDSENVAFVAFQRPDDGIAVVVVNKNDEVVPVAPHGKQGSCDDRPSSRPPSKVTLF